jgi:D-alanyl-D-alanine carboxypeptidase
MGHDRTPMQRFDRARVNRRQALGVAAAGAMGSLVMRPRRATATGPQTTPWAEERTATISDMLPQGSIPGAIVGVWQDGQPPYREAFGVQDPDTGDRMTRDLAMRIGSNTKRFTTTAILQLVDQGRIGLDDPVGTYVSGVPNRDQITIRQLGMMRSGLFDYTAVAISEWPSRSASGRPRNNWPSPSAIR